MNRIKTWITLMLLAGLAACGGGGGTAGAPILGGGGTGGVTDLVITLSSNTLANSGAQTVTATVTAVDASRNVVPNVPVSVSADANAVVTAESTTTDSGGIVRATIGIGSDRSTRTITVTARNGNLTKSATITVSETAATAVASDLVLTISARSIANNGTQTVTAIATALDARRNVLSGVAVQLSVDSNATITPNATTTDATGTVRGIIGVGSDRTNRTIRVTATSGNLTRTETLQVSDSTGGAPVAADLSLSLSAATLNNSGTAAIVARAVAVDSNRNAVSGIPITFRVDNSAVATVSGTVTDANGIVQASVVIGADRSNRVVTVTASSGTLTRAASFRVIGADLSAVFAPLVTANTPNNQVEFRLTDVNALAMVDQPITVSAPGLPTISGQTDSNGRFVYTYSAPTQPGALQITAAAAGDSEVANITVQAPGAGSILPADVIPLSASVSANPSVVSVNTAGSRANQTELRALFLGPDNKPIPRVRVRFDLDGNRTNTDGVIEWLGGNYAYSDVNGVARATFTPGQRSSPTDGVRIRICYSTTDFPFNAADRTASCPSAAPAGGGFAFANLTVANEALSVSLRTNERIKSGTANLTYIKEFVVLVVDAAGQAKQDVLITPSLDLTAYYKGFYEVRGERWVQRPTLLPDENYRWDAASRAWVKAGLIGGQCPNEDANRNAVREAPSFIAGAAAPEVAARQEDLSWNNELDPRKADVAIKMVGSNRTDASGLAIVQIEYGKSLGSWVDFLISVTASGISGTESLARFAGTLPVDADSINDIRASPAFVTSPYGTSAVCTDAR
ncbi:MAG: hypothetical protein ACOVQT_11835 [Rubrivivax sp.]